MSHDQRACLYHNLKSKLNPSTPTRPNNKVRHAYKKWQFKWKNNVYSNRLNISYTVSYRAMDIPKLLRRLSHPCTKKCQDEHFERHCRRIFNPVKDQTSTPLVDRIFQASTYKEVTLQDHTSILKTTNPNTTSTTGNTLSFSQPIYPISEIVPDIPPEELRMARELLTQNMSDKNEKLKAQR
ncbi:hypothetical protein GLOIN_2v1767314 [Rhizophagus irregularis DAOM 181602=DAOM 197198]|uniref:DUF8211 domain-containing protein n=2 Tax=Rhizophagus irregularis TaxID=588596 RepID=U9SZE1_RHIID|nr:hypothetical protein GLOIN_2v1767314 [Rhizophagus irregularis DAOM 181602=DAOM 197198]EXX57700.1 hypothetical protein RirG_204710 [Rhizophagus irregularis DAOM 197198w]POG77997.1 hypothetical protein GLOIN_2v1767314 [Rhizophagus irregularis DAOM 181602=DAOM 197198]|eukprot:XP_025184863.1 hypothetical protein GLOIN_2v1767314 [Rhizophagus irregularis DAOM 181602=DAOM 197198]